MLRPSSLRYALTRVSLLKSPRTPHFRLHLRREISGSKVRHNSTTYNPHTQASREQTLSDAQRRTIYALSTPPGRGGVAVIRVSGPHALLVWESMVRKPRNAPFPSPWRMEWRKIIHPETEEQLDEGLVVFFKGPKSFTTEDVVELHIHSGRAVISSVLNALDALPFCRQAEPGEFTRRAFLGGRLDLTQVEGLQDLINADTESQRRLALGAVGGHVRAQFDDLRSRIIRCLANVEALIDFGEGEDIEEGVYQQSQVEARALLALIRNYLKDTRRGEIIRSGIRLTIFGPPNAGKSSLLNFLAQRDAAIVTPIPGTTRDVLDVSLDIAGLPVIVSDTAGLRQTDDVVEMIGVQRAKDAVSKSDVALCVLSFPDLLRKTPNGYRLEIPESVRTNLIDDTLILLNKSDLISGAHQLEIVKQVFPEGWIASLATGEGLPEFVDGMGQTLLDRFGLQPSDASPLITRIRHRMHLESACRFLEAFLATPPADIVLAAEELRYAARAVGKVSGLIDVEHILDSVFKDFCIGK